MSDQPSAPKGVTYLTGSGWMKGIEPLLKQIGSCEVPVLIQGETGVGKEVIARQLCAQSPRANKVFLKLNCAALPSELVENELFGYERFAFTGAFQKKPGKFEMADCGTILLDEIGDMDLKLQAKLLQVLQDQEFQRLGGKETTRVDLRVIAATHCDLEKSMADGRFREDLYYRLSVVTLRVPPLRGTPGRDCAHIFSIQKGQPEQGGRLSAGDAMITAGYKCTRSAAWLGAWDD